eukprot:TRINITY_DN41594_c0_g1_i1.p1 TRINITY_DN41594_c0_g1~~TRINITY_DN41594_c0_g1_i1.p1  ORF type:complete len:1464 (+),score=323.89 TRINITY_DN41594_c0_g1_i1:78-4469(+)
MAAAARAAALARIQAQNEGGAKATDQYVVEESKKIVETVTEEEYKQIMNERRRDFIVGEKDRGYADSGKEFWQGEDAVRERERQDDLERQRLGEEATPQKRPVKQESQLPPAPSGRGALLSAFRQGASSSSSGLHLGASNKDQNKDVDDLLAEMCGELEADDGSALPPKRKLEPTSAVSGGRPSKRAAGAAKKAKQEPTPVPPSVKEEPQDAVMEEAANAASSSAEELKEELSSSLSATQMEEALSSTQMEALSATQVEALNNELAARKEEATAALAALPDSWLGGSSSPATASHLTAASGAKTLLLDEDGGLWFFFVDAFEDDRSSPPRVYLFGKVRMTSSAPGSAHDFQSCCLVVEKMERCFHLLLNGCDDPDDVETAQNIAQNAEAEFDELCRKNCPGVRKIRAKLKWRNYAFEKQLPSATGNLPFLKVLCDPAGTTPLLGLRGHSFSHSFGIQTSLLERLMLTKRIMGPSWLRLSSGSFAQDNAKLSTCALEFRVTPKSFEVPRTEADRARLASTMPPSSPPVRLLSLNLQTLQANAQQPHEVLAIACTFHPTVSPDASESERELRNGMGHWAGVRRLDTKPFPRDGEKVLSESNIQTCNNELALLHAFLDKVQEFDPDVIAGHNAYGFDLDVLANRLHQLRVQPWQKFGRLKRPRDRVPRIEGRQGQGFWVGSNLTAGRLVCDVLLQSRDLLPKMASYDLPSLACDQLGGEKLSVVEPESLAGYYDSAKSLLSLLQINLQGAFAVARLAQSLQILPLTRQLTNLAGNLWNSSLQNKRAERNELLLCHEFHRKKFVLPDKENLQARKRRMQVEGGGGLGLDNAEEPEANAQGSGPRRGKAAYSGGLVLEPKAGLYDDFVMMLDFNSLYPSIIQEHNICFTTVERPDETQVEKIASEAELLAQTHEPDGTTEEGILPQVLRRLVESRRSVKNSMKSERNPKVLQVLEIRQKALKLTANSMYGCLGFSNSRFYAKPLAALITAKGRAALQTTITVVQQELQLDVVYGDTDSVFVNTKTADYDQAMQAAQQIKRSVNKRYKRLEIEIDAIFVRLMLLKKKKYAALKVTNWEKRQFEREFKGLDIVRRDWCPLAKDIGESILMKVLNSNGKEEAVHWTHEFLAEKAAEMDELKVPNEKYIITKAITKDPKDYPDAKNQPHVQVALRLMARGKAVRPGQEIEYVIVEAPDGDGPKASLADRARHPHELFLDSSLRLDLAWYKKQQVHPLVSRLLATVEGTSQARLAECLGMDGSRFAQAAIVRDAAEGGDSYAEAAGADVNAIFDRAARFKDFPTRLTGLKCSACGEVSSWLHLLAPQNSKADEAEAAKQAWQPFCCSSCCKQAHPSRAQNVYVTQLRQLLKEYSEGWVLPSEDSGHGAIERTRRLAQGQALVGSRTVLKELEFIEYLCQCGLREAALQDAIEHRTAVEAMLRVTQHQLASSANFWVNCGQIFGSIFGSASAGA